MKDVDELLEDYKKLETLCHKLAATCKALTFLCHHLAKACNKIRLHELLLKKRGIGYDGDVHKWAESALEATKKSLQEELERK